MIRHLTAGILGALVTLTGCVDINGGAVELRWEIRKMDGARSSCSSERVESVTLCATGSDAGATECYPSFRCSDSGGSTEFVIPPGRYSLAIELGCVGGGDALAILPDPIVRDISNGNVAELNTLLIVKNSTSFICPATP